MGSVAPCRRLWRSCACILFFWARREVWALQTLRGARLSGALHNRSDTLKYGEQRPTSRALDLLSDMDRVLRQCIFQIMATMYQFCENSSPVIGGDHGSEARWAPVFK